jgi:hypothetical protein
LRGKKNGSLVKREWLDREKKNESHVWRRRKKDDSRVWRRRKKNESRA